MRVLLDTNGVLDFVLERDKHFENAARIFELLDKGTIEVFVAAITPINVLYTTRKEKNLEAAHEAVRFLLNAVEFCDNGLMFTQRRKTAPGGAYESHHFALNDLAKNFGVARKRIRAIYGGIRKKPEIEFWLVPRGEKPPAPRPNLPPVRDFSELHLSRADEGT